MNTFQKIKNELQTQIEHLEKEYQEQKTNSPLPGNPYITGLGGKIGGLRSALRTVEQVEKDIVDFYLKGEK